jgi:hypothetical protein
MDYHDNGHLVARVTTPLYQFAAGQMVYALSERVPTPTPVFGRQHAELCKILVVQPGPFTTYYRVRMLGGPLLGREVLLEESALSRLRPRMAGTFTPVPDHPRTSYRPGALLAAAAPGRQAEGDRERQRPSRSWLRWPSWPRR